MKNIKVTVLLIVVIFIFTDTATGEDSKEFKNCEYIHLIITGKSDLPFQTFNKVRLPIYIGYVKAMRKATGIQEIEMLSFVRKTTLPIDWINRALDEVIRTRSVYKFTDGIRSRNYYYDEEFFLHALSEMLETLGVSEIMTESYIDFYIQGDFPPPLLKAEDFEYDKTCVYRPYANPPEYCSDIYPVTLVNKEALEAKIKAYYDDYDKQKMLKVVFLRGGKFFKYGY